MSSPSHQPHLMIVIHSLNGGGAERVAADLSAYWVLRGYRVSVVTQTDPSTDAYVLHQKVKRHVLGTASASAGRLDAVLANLRRVWRLRRIIKRERPTVVLGMMTTSSILAIVAARSMPCRVIATEHTHPPSQELPEIWQRLRRWAYPQASAVVALTAGTSAWLEKHVPGSQLTVIPNAVRWPLERSEPIIEPPPRQGRYRILAVGRLHPHKGFDLLIRAFEEIAGHFPNWDLVILGEGELRDTLQQQIDDAGLADRISMPGRVGNVADWYVQADLYALSSRVEGLSNTLLEAMASGLAPVAFDCETGPREIVRNGIDGVLVSPADDNHALAAHLSDMMAHPAQREAFARRAVDVRDRFSTTRIMALWGHLFEVQ
ncbi:glycosyltransferase family 4 protein [Pollutimonas thiosulfatoxidans]|uniref:Glycosyl transferase n=1 Tax=Pollutimonas thiosulfatoxidans TaxID=2028345 RepID=A0A410GGI0_9BURK|nr:glycosyltransferase family 4 protein [Pollutimonas thiosulfatoxidans]NYT43766.1 glycosyltransferase family 4 protein [Alcaligenaceae bacterium]QAA95391.1 glycosyl transferase [Pollutimonas thiosulfatoxidans]